MDVEEIEEAKFEREIFSEVSLLRLLKYFPDYQSLLVYHAEQMQERFPQKSNLEGCEFCNRKAAQINSQFKWQGDYYDSGQAAALIFVGLMTRHLSASKPDLQVGFTTHHYLCKSCYSSMKWKRFFAELIDKLSIIFILLAVVLVMGGLFICGLAIAWKSEIAILMRGLAGLVVGGLCLVGFFRYIFKIYSWILPKELRMISKPPFKLIQIK
jgi:hypothetical protein